MAQIDQLENAGSVVKSNRDKSYKISVVFLHGGVLVNFKPWLAGIFPTLLSGKISTPFDSLKI